MEDNLKMTRKHFSKLGWVCLLGAVIIFVVQILGSAAFAFIQSMVAQLGSKWKPSGAVLLLSQIVPMYVLGMPAFIWMLKRLPGAVPERHSIKKGQFVALMAMCYPVMIGCNIIGLSITFLIGLLKGSAVDNVMMNMVMNTDNLIVMFLYAVICAPIFEEIVFRKLLVDSVLPYGKGIAVLMSGLIFGLFHGNLNQFAYAFTLGMLFAFVYVKTGNIKITIGLHMFINFMGTIVGALILRVLPMDEMNAATASQDPQAMVAMVQNHLGAWVIYMLYGLFIFAIIITGIILWVINFKHFTLKGSASEVSEENRIPKGKRFQTIILNPGMIAYCLFWLIMIVVQILM